MCYNYFKVGDSMKKLKKNKYRLLTVIIWIFSYFILMTGVTYAYFALSASDEKNIVGTAASGNLNLTVSRVAPSNDNNVLVPLLDNALENAISGNTAKGAISPCIDSNHNVSCEVYKIVIENTSTAAVKLNGNIYLNSSNSSSSFQNLKWEILDNATKRKTDYFSNSMYSTSLVKDLSLSAKGNSDSSQTIYLAIWISEINDNQSALDYGKYGATISFTSTNGGITSTIGIVPTGVDMLNNLFENNTKTSVSAASSEKIIQVTSKNLEKDSNGNIRYYGLSPNNYVTFNNESAGWRIIGIFDTEDSNGNWDYRIKLIRDKALGSYSWDSSISSINGGQGINDFSKSDIMTLLNDYYYHSKSAQTCYKDLNNISTTCDFSSNGIKSSYQNMIDDVKYYLGGSNNASQYPNKYYTFERSNAVYSSNPKTWIGKLGLMYPSDYGYATDLNTCKVNLRSYSTTNTCTTNNWLYLSGHQWTITPSISNSINVYGAWQDGSVYDYPPAYSYLIRPVLYLKPNVIIVSGNGTKEAPYLLSLDS